MTSSPDSKSFQFKLKDIVSVKTLTTPITSLTTRITNRNNTNTNTSNNDGNSTQTNTSAWNLPIPQIKLSKVLNVFNSTNSNTNSIQEYLHIETIDQTPLKNSIILLADCENFIQRADQTLTLADKSIKTSELVSSGTNTTTKILSPFLITSTMVNKYRTKQKGNKLFQEFDSLIERLKESEDKLRVLTELAVSDTMNSLFQALHLKSRLNSCIQFNSGRVELLSPLVAELTILNKQLEKNEKDVKHILGFQEEIMTLEEFESSSYIPWAIRSSEDTQEKTPPAKKNPVETRYKNIQKALLLTQQVLNKHKLELSERTTDLNQAKKVLLVLDGIVHKVGAYRDFIREVETASDNTENKDIGGFLQFDRDSEGEGGEGEAENEEFDKEDNSKQFLLLPEFQEALRPYDHAHCSNCSCVTTLANDCVMHLAALHHLSQDSTQKLQEIILIHEKMKDKSLLLESIGWGDSL